MPDEKDLVGRRVIVRSSQSETRTGAPEGRRGDDGGQGTAATAAGGARTVFIDELWRRQRNRTNDSRSPARGELTSLGLSNLTSISLSGRVCSGTRAWPSTVSVCEAHSSIRKCAPESETPTASWRAEFHTGATVLALVGHEMMPPTQRSRESTAHITTCTFGGFSPGDNRLLPTRTETRWIVGAPDTSS
eukprot:scaffold63172_cov27-Tisochrysis_lutea.AAC.2